MRFHVPAPDRKPLTLHPANEAQATTPADSSEPPTGSSDDAPAETPDDTEQNTPEKTPDEDTTYTYRVCAYNAAGNSTVTLDTNVNFTDDDRYWIQNRAILIDTPGEWAVENNGGQYNIYFRPASIEDLEHTQAPSPNIYSRLVRLKNTNNSEIKRFRDYRQHQLRHILHGISKLCNQRCVVHNNGLGVSARQSTGLLISKNIIQKNYIHHHLRIGHPDNVQIHNNVTNLEFTDNLLLAGGQSVMMESTHSGGFYGNAIIASGGNSLGFGHGNAYNYAVQNNTVAFLRYLPLTLSAYGYDVRENIFMTGNTGWACILKDDPAFDNTGDRNVFYNYQVVCRFPWT